VAERVLERGAERGAVALILFVADVDDVAARGKQLDDPASFPSISTQTCPSGKILS